MFLWISFLLLSQTVFAVIKLDLELRLENCNYSTTKFSLRLKKNLIWPLGRLCRIKRRNVRLSDKEKESLCVEERKRPTQNIILEKQKQRIFQK